MGRLPPHHIRRPRLTAQCRGGAVVVVEAAAGYGKTVLGAELADMWRSVAIEVVLHEGSMPAQLFAARLRMPSKRRPCRCGSRCSAGSR